MLVKTSPPSSGPRASWLALQIAWPAAGQVAPRGAANRDVQLTCGRSTWWSQYFAAPRSGDTTTSSRSSVSTSPRDRHHRATRPEVGRRPGCRASGPSTCAGAATSSRAAPGRRPRNDAGVGGRGRGPRSPPPVGLVSSSSTGRPARRVRRRTRLPNTSRSYPRTRSRLSRCAIAENTSAAISSRALSRKSIARYA
jgi:hypothetical protein